MTDIVTIGDATLYHGDCMDILPTLGKVDAVVTDPPYGIGSKWDKKECFKKAGGILWTGLDGWDNETNQPAIDMCLKLSDGNCIIWGGNYYNLPPSRGYLVWDKMQVGFSLADSELAWVGKPITPKTYRYARAQLASEGKVHPTQKPLRLMRWAINFLPDCNLILDPFMGSGTTGVACAHERTFIGIEKERKYFDIACERIEAAYAQGRLAI